MENNSGNIFDDRLRRMLADAEEMPSERVWLTARAMAPPMLPEPMRPKVYFMEITPVLYESILSSAAVCFS